MTPPDDELLSAYLDGELADDERARVERLLAEQPESRQLLEELRAVKQSLGSMPVARLGDDFAERVLRQAEREMLTEGFRVQGSGFSEPSADGAVIKTSPRVERENRSAVRGDDLFSWQRIRRPLIWASLALAAGLLIMFVDRDRQKPKQVAMAPEGAEPQQRGGQRNDAEISAARGDRPVADAARALSERGEPSGERDSLRLHDDENGKNSVLRDGDAVESDTEAAPLLRSRSGGAARRLMTDQLNENLGAQAEELGKNTEPMERSFGLGGESFGETPFVDDQTLVVWSVVSPDAPPEESFSQLLAEQNIAIEPGSIEPGSIEPGSIEPGSDEPGSDEPGSDEPGSDATGSDAYQPGAKRAQAEREAKAEAFYYKAESGETLALSVDAKELADTLQRRGLERADKRHKPPAVDALQSPGAQMILVEATDEQVKAVLEAMDQDRDTYRTVEVEPAPKAPNQQLLSHYSRGALTLEKESAKRMGRMSVQNRAADLRQSQGRAVRLKLQAGVEAADKENTDKENTDKEKADKEKAGDAGAPVPAARVPAARVPAAPAPAAALPAAAPLAGAAGLGGRGSKSAAGGEPGTEQFYRVLFVLVPPADEEAKPALKTPADKANPER